LNFGNSISRRSSLATVTFLAVSFFSGQALRAHSGAAAGAAYTCITGKIPDAGI